MRSPGRDGFELPPDDDDVATPLDAPPGQGIESRRGERIARSQAEAGVVPRTADCVTDDDPVGERRAIVSALGADREQVVALANEENGLAADMAFDDMPIAEAHEANALGEVRPLRALCM